MKVDKWTAYLHRILLPGQCILCGANTDENDICDGCASDLPWLQRVCPRCALPCAAAGCLCGRCRETPPAWHAAFCLLRYTDPADGLLLSLKFQRRLAVARVLGRLMADALAARGPAVDLIVPVPLHSGRLRERGFNQAVELARPIARRLCLPLARSACVRIRATDAQSGLDAQARRRNVRRAFAAGRQADGRRIAVVDDVLTTGATAGAIAIALREAGARWIEIWCAARADTGRRRPQPSDGASKV